MKSPQIDLETTQDKRETIKVRNFYRIFVLHLAFKLSTFSPIQTLIISLLHNDHRDAQIT